MRTITVRKLNPLYFIITIIFVFLLYYYSDTHYIRSSKLITSFKTEIPTVPIHERLFETNKTNEKIKYILLWTNPYTYPYIYFGEGSTMFKKKKCKFDNCYVTSNRVLLGHYSEFDIIAFNGPQLFDAWNVDDMPKVRSPQQKYVYTNIESEQNYPICSNTFDKYFNWTWTYKLNSDAIWGYLVIRNSTKHVIGPSLRMDWKALDNMDPIDNKTKLMLTFKSKAAAWFVSNCNTMSKRESYVVQLQHFLSAYNLQVDVFGECGTFQCPKEILKRCLMHAESKYYFFLAFENAISEDYVTEKVLHALNHYMVPIVLGGANYSRFLPPGSYLDAGEYRPEDLAREIDDIIQSPELYQRFFRWRKYYSYHLRHESPDTDDYCGFCSLANDEERVKNVSTYDNFSAWWTSQTRCSALTNPVPNV